MRRHLARPPRALARLRPSPVRARISSRSNSARPPRIVSISRPCAVVVSAQLSFSDLKPAPRLLISASTLSRFPGRARQPIEPADNHRVAFLEPAHELPQLRTIGLRQLWCYCNTLKIFKQRHIAERIAWSHEERISTNWGPYS